MSSEPAHWGPAPVHPLVGAVETIASALDEAAGTDPGYLRAADKRHVNRLLGSCREQLEGLRLAVLAESAEVAYASGARSTGDWGAHLALRDPAQGRADQRLIDRLERYAAVADALRHGKLSRDHADRIGRILDGLPARVGADVLAKAEQTLIEHAADCTPRQLRILGRRILELVAPETAEDEERRRLEDEERHAAEQTSLTLHDRGDGTTRIHGLIPTLAADVLRALLAAYTSPRRDHHHDDGPTAGTTSDDKGGTGSADTTSSSGGSSDGSSGGSSDGTSGTHTGTGGTHSGANGDTPDRANATGGTFAEDAICGPTARGGMLARRDPATGQRLPHHRLLGEAFCSLLEHVPTDALPIHGHSPATIVITLSFEQLRDQTGTATLTGAGDGTETITPGQARRLACTADLVPAVLSSDSQVLDLGRSSRLFTAAQRRAKQLSTPVCEAAGCDMPAPFCEMHHDQPWTLDGATDLHNAVLLCAFHHHRTHDHDFTHDRLPNGDIRYHRRT